MKTLAERIKNLPEGTKLYSPCYGEVEFMNVDNYGINCQDVKGYSQCFLANGTVHVSGECMLFPSKEERDWDKFLAGRNKFDVRTLQPFDKVLVRDDVYMKWHPDIYGYYRNNKFHCSCTFWSQCVPYNDDTKHLLGTTEQAPEYYVTWEE